MAEPSENTMETRLGKDQMASVWLWITRATVPAIFVLGVGDWFTNISDTQQIVQRQGYVIETHTGELGYLTDKLDQLTDKFNRLQREIDSVRADLKFHRQNHPGWVREPKNNETLK